MDGFRAAGQFEVEGQPVGAEVFGTVVGLVAGLVAPAADEFSGGGDFH